MVCVRPLVAAGPMLASDHGVAGDNGARSLPHWYMVGTSVGNRVRPPLWRESFEPCVARAVSAGEL